MRLFTFQHKSAMRVLEDGSWYSRRGHRIKPIDWKHVNEDEDIYPIYTFATTGMSFTPYFSVYSFAHSLAHLSGYMQFNLPEMVMIELEVPESFILNMKQNSRWYCQECDKDDPDILTTEKDRKSGRWIHYKADFSRGIYFEDNYLQHARELRKEHELEALIPCIMKEHIVAIRGFESSEGRYGDHTCYTIYTNEKLCPLWDCAFIVNGKSHTKLAEATPACVRVRVEKIEAEGKHPCIENIIQHYCGAKAVPGYFTVAEALHVANLKLTMYLERVIEEYSIDENNLDNIRISARDNIVLTEDGTYITPDNLKSGVRRV